MIGNKINEFIMTHIELWHNTSPARLDPTLDVKTRVELFMRTRACNVLRAKIRDEINKYFNSGYPDPKIGYKNDSI